jgi:hypothetical protein
MSLGREYHYDKRLKALVLFERAFPDDTSWEIAKLGSVDINGNVLTEAYAIKVAEEWNKELREGDA